MIETADSKISSNNWIRIVRLNEIKDTAFLVFPSKVNKRCPAIILGDKRIAKVPGRILFPIVSMHTINGIRIKGVPWGIKRVNICIILLIHPKIINVIHSGKAIENVKVLWLEELKVRE